MVDVDRRRDQHDQAGVDRHPAESARAEHDVRQRPDGRARRQCLAEVRRVSGPVPGRPGVVRGHPEILHGVPEHDPEGVVSAEVEAERLDARGPAEMLGGQRQREPQRLREHESGGRSRGAPRGLVEHQSGESGGTGDPGGAKDQQRRVGKPERESERNEAHGRCRRHGVRHAVRVNEEERHCVGEDEGRVEPALHARRHIHPAPTQEHRADTVVLSRVVPGAPGQIERRHQRRENHVVEGGDERRADEHRRVDREDRVALPLGTLLVHAQQRRPIVRSAEKQDQRGKHVVRLDGAKLRTGHQGGAEEHPIEKPTTQKQVGDGAEQPGGRGWRGRPVHLTDSAPMRSFQACGRIGVARR